MGHEAHFEVELGEFGLAVAALRLIAEALGDLVIALQARHHQQLLVLLGTLGKGVKEAGFEAIGDEVIPCAFWGGFGEYGGLGLNEVAGVEVGADFAHGGGAQSQLLAHSRATNVQVSVLNP